MTDRECVARELSRQSGNLGWAYLSARQTAELLDRADRVLLALYRRRLDAAFGHAYAYENGACVECGYTDGTHQRDCGGVS